MATPAPRASGTVRTIAALARMPVPTTDEGFHAAASSIRATCDELAGVVAILAAQTEKELSYGPRNGVVDRFRARRMARQATAPWRQSAERLRAAGASGTAGWVRFNRIYAALMHPPANRRGFDFTAGRRRAGG